MQLFQMVRTLVTKRSWHRQSSPENFCAVVTLIIGGFAVIGKEHSERFRFPNDGFRFGDDFLGSGTQGRSVPYTSEFYNSISPRTALRHRARFEICAKFDGKGNAALAGLNCAFVQRKRLGQCYRSFKQFFRNELSLKFPGQITFQNQEKGSPAGWKILLPKRRYTQRGFTLKNLNPRRYRREIDPTLAAL